jgi:hypothetical protein
MAVGQRLKHIALEDHLGLGETVDVFGKRYRLVKEITRDQFVASIEASWRDGQERRLGPPKTGEFNPATKRYLPGKQPPHNYKYFYEVEVV